MTPEAQAMLARIHKAGGTWPASPLANRPMGRELMRLGLIELIEPPAPHLPYAVLTKSGQARADVLGG